MININPANKGKLHKALGVTQGDPIPAPKLNKALKSANPTLKKEAVFAKNAKGFNHSKGAVGNVAAGKPPAPKITPINTDRGSFGMK